VVLLLSTEHCVVLLLIQLIPAQYNFDRNSGIVVWVMAHVKEN